MKGILDRVLALGGLLVLLPLMAVLCVVVRATSPGPVFFVQRRVGRNGRAFGILKLRTMVADAEQATGPIWAQENDPRITPIGRFLRATHFDEIPQLINVLKGEMSLVGPRPERPVFVEQFRREIPFYEERLTVKPGITGLAQVRHRYDETLKDVRRKVAYDRLYIRKMCLLLDLRIILLTIGRLTGKGAR